MGPSPQSSGAREETTRDLFRSYESFRPGLIGPPSCDEPLQDLPPDHTNTDALAFARRTPDDKSPWECLPLHVHDSQSTARQPSDAVDWSSREGFRMLANKREKKAAKEAAHAKWADSGNGGNKDGAGEEKAGHDGGGAGGDNDAGAGGDGGGDPPGGGGNGDGGEDLWGGFAAPPSKKKKKNKVL